MNKLHQFLTAHPAQRRCAVIALLLAVLAVLFLDLLRWPTLTPEGTVRRLERANLLPPGVILATGELRLTWNADQENRVFWVASQTAQGHTLTAVEQLWGFLYRPWGRNGGVIDAVDDRYAPFRFLNGRTAEGNDGYLEFIFTHPDVRRLEYRRSVSFYSEDKKVLSDPLPATMAAPGVWVCYLSEPYQGDGAFAPADTAIIAAYDGEGRQRFP